MNITTLKKVLPILMRHKVVPFIWGAQGIGKTQSVRQLAKEESMGFVHLHLATQEVGDLVGLLIKNEDGTVKHARPEWFPTEGKGVVFLDELNRAHPDVLQAMFSFILDGTIHRHKLPEGWRIIAAGNYQSNMNNVTDTSDSAWMSRFCHIDLDPTHEEFLVFLESKGTKSNVADFIRAQPEMLQVKHTERINTSLITPDPRCWESMVDVLDQDPTMPEDIKYEVFSGLVGPTPAAAFMTWKKKNESKISGRDILSFYNKVKERVLSSSDKSTVRYDLLNSAAEEILVTFNGRSLSDTELNNFKEFLYDVPFEMGLKIVTKLGTLDNKQKNVILNDADYVNKFMSRRR